MHSSRFTILKFKYSIFIYVAKISFSVRLDAYLDVTISGRLCLGTRYCRGTPNGRIALTPSVRAVPSGSASLSVLVNNMYLACTQYCMWFRYLLSHIHIVIVLYSDLLVMCNSLLDTVCDQNRNHNFWDIQLPTRASCNSSSMRSAIQVPGLWRAPPRFPC